VLWTPSVALLLAQTPQAAPERRDPAATGTVQPAPTFPQRVQLRGLPNFGRVSKQLSRGAQPNASGFQELKKLGIDVVVNLRHESTEISRERELVQAQGMQYVSIPWRGSQNPDNGQIAQFLELLHAKPDKHVFVHCQRGAERTGVMVACYRMSEEGWTAAKALTEMEQFGFRGLLFGHLKKFVREFPSLLVSDPLLQKERIGG
jgi:protein tyrosine/serine phosphatase